MAHFASVTRRQQLLQPQLVLQTTSDFGLLHSHCVEVYYADVSEGSVVLKSTSFASAQRSSRL